MVKTWYNLNFLELSILICFRRVFTPKVVVVIGNVSLILHARFCTRAFRYNSFFNFSISLQKFESCFDDLNTI